jgi:hypothetical protein
LANAFLVAYLIKGSTSITTSQVTHERQWLLIPKEAWGVVGVRGWKSDCSRGLLSWTLYCWKQ